MKDFTGNALVQRSVEFSLLIIKYVETLENSKKFVIAKQLLRSGTSIGACIMEAQSAESKADFIHKLKIADKEAHEASYWLYLCKRSENYPFDEALDSKLTEVMKLLNSIIASARNK
jgi:four helix bundle protein